MPCFAEDDHRELRLKGYNLGAKEGSRTDEQVGLGMS